MSERAALPPRDLSKPAEQQGLFSKFLVQRRDGTDAPGEKHHGCEYFVLDVSHDPAARAALAAYASAVESTHPLLARDMRVRYNLFGPSWPFPAPPTQGGGLTQCDMHEDESR